MPDMANAAMIEGYGLRKHRKKKGGTEDVRDSPEYWTEMEKQYGKAEAAKQKRMHHRGKRLKPVVHEMPVDIPASPSRRKKGGIVTVLWPDGSIKSDCFGSYPQGTKWPGSKKKPAKPGTVGELIEKAMKGGSMKRKRGRGFDGEFDLVAPADRMLWNAQKRSRVNTGHTSLYNTGFY
jgi:hypothetical protein